MRDFTRLCLLGAVGASFALAGCSDDDDDFVITTIGESLNGLGLTTLNTAVVAAELDDDLSDPAGTFTVFAPTNGAFNGLPAGMLTDLLDPANQAALVSLLQRHILTTEVGSAAASALSGATTLGGADILIDSIGGQLYVNDARVITADLDATNGFVHTIDGVLTQPETVYDTLTTRGLDTLKTAVDAAELDDDLAGAGPFTLLAPTDAAFDALPAGTLDDLLMPANQGDLISLLQYHLVSGLAARASDAVAAELVTTTQGSNVIFSETPTTVRVNGVDLSVFNIQATNGVVHVIDAVLTEPGDIPMTATDDPELSTLVGLLGDASLVGALSDPNGPFTVFAPVNAAFDALDPADLAYLSDAANVADLTAVLNYHVVDGNLTAAEVLQSTDLTTLEGTTIAVDAAATPPTVGGADLGTLDVLASNGIVHTLGGVLIPASVEPNLPSSAFATFGDEGDEGDEGLPTAAVAAEPKGLVDLMQNDGAAALPAWTGTSAALAAGWDRFDDVHASPMAPDAAGSTATGLALIAGTGAAATAVGDLTFRGLGGDLRVDADVASVPFEVVLQVAGSGLERLAPELRIAVDGQVQNLPADALELLPSGELLATWRPALAGARTSGLDAIVIDGQGGVDVEALRFLALQ